MARKVKFYYTFKMVEEPLDSAVPLRFECHKWEPEGEHVVTYKVRPETEWQACSCDAWRKCKHMKCVEEILSKGIQHELHKWKWDEVNSWQQLDDIPDITEVDVG